MILTNISSVVLSVGFLLMVTGVRFMMVRNSLKAGKPSDERLKTLKKEFLSCSIGGGALFALFIVGAIISYFPLSVAKIIGNTGGIIFGLGIPQYVQLYYGRNEHRIKKAPKQLKTWTWVLFIIGVVLATFSQFMSGN